MQKERWRSCGVLVASGLAALFFLTPATAGAGRCHHHYNHSAWHGRGMAIVFCLDSPEYDSCALHRHSTGELLGNVPKHSALDRGRQVYTLNTTPGSNFPYAIDFVCRYGGNTDTINIANGASYENGCCPAPSYLGGACCQGSGPRDAGLPDLRAPDAGNPGNEPACEDLLSREYTQGTQDLWGVTPGSSERLSFTVDAVPAPGQLAFARLSMRLNDADHPNEEGYVYVNSSPALALPANGAWGEQTVSATLALPVDYLVAGTNIIRFGPGSRDQTYYKVSKVALTVFGDACAPQADAAMPDTAQPDATWPDVTSPDATQSDLTSSDTWVADGDTPDVRVSDSGSSADLGQEADTKGHEHKAVGGCGCSVRKNASSGPLGFLLLGALLLRWRRVRG